MGSNATDTMVSNGHATEIHSSAVVAPDAMLYPGTRIEQDVWIGPRCLIGTSFEDGPILTTISSSARIGAGSIIAGGVNVGRGAVVHPGSVVLQSIPPFTIVSGNPARIEGYVGIQSPTHPTSFGAELGLLKVPGAALLPVTSVSDMRGNLVAIEYSSLPFAPQRTFTVSGVPNEELRGQHAHHTLHQFLVCLVGSVSVMVDDGSTQDEVRLNRPSVGLHIPPMIWGVQYRYSADAVLLVMASAPYEDADYIRDYEEFYSLVRRNKTDESGSR